MLLWKPRFQTKGPVVLPVDSGAKTGSPEGDPLDAKVEGWAHCCLTTSRRARKVSIVVDLTVFRSSEGQTLNLEQGKSGSMRVYPTSHEVSPRRERSRCMGFSSTNTRACRSLGPQSGPSGVRNWQLVRFTELGVVGPRTGTDSMDSPSPTTHLFSH